MHNDDLSKVTLSGYSRTPPESFSGLEKCLDHGMKLARYALHTLDAVKFHNHSSNTLKRVRTLPGLEGILLQLYHGIPASFPQWLSILSIHPTLKELWLIDELCSCDIPTTALISFLDEKYHCQDLTRGFDMECVVFNRDIGRSSSSQEWYVKAITLKSNSATTSLIQMLTLAASAFPELEVLTLRLEFHEAKYDVGDFVSVFAQFFSLRAVFLHDVYKRLIFESANDNSMPSPPVKITVYRAPNPDETIPIIPAASGILQITSLLAKQNKTLDFFSFKDEISRDEDGQLSCPGPGSGKLVFLEGELQVLNSNRDVDASFMVYSTPG
ncbi:hypothetical protein F5878DRAFT_661548 [Lentinula raphanica]|uniref:Uncharacterized protein n=1 Tax=Lentinula raphanica TaxID=153919 RepID=A0AA38P8I3_9AGAR|nr:hypothetical protein F5878DRAFT_661548 [Lentinula raphanica]